MQSSIFENFTNVYPVTKTLRFSLIPVGETLNNISKDKVIENDEYLSKKEHDLKKICDEFYVDFVENVFENISNETFIVGKKNNKENLIECYFAAYKEKDAEKKTKYSKEIISVLTKEFRNDKRFEKMFNGKMLTDILPEYVNGSNNKLELIELFKGKSTRFTNYYQNRSNMFNSDGKAGSIGERFISNLNKHFANIIIFEKVMGIFDEYDSVELEKVINLTEINSLDNFFSTKNFTSLLLQKDIVRYNSLIGGISTESEKIKGLNEYINLYNQKNKTKYNKFSKIDKQILSDINSMSFKLDAYTTDEDVFSDVKKIIYEIRNNIVSCKNSIFSYFRDFDICDLDKIYIKMDTLNSISYRYFGDYSVIENILVSEQKKKNPQTEIIEYCVFYNSFGKYY